MNIKTMALIEILVLTAGCMTVKTHKRQMSAQAVAADRAIQDAEKATSAAQVGLVDAENSARTSERANILKMLAETPPKDLVKAWILLKESNGNPATREDLKTLGLDALTRAKQSGRK